MGAISLVAILKLSGFSRDSRFSPAAGLKSGQFDRERNCAILA